MDAVLLAFQLAMQYGPLVKQAIDIATSNTDIITKLKNEAAALLPTLTNLGVQQFPGIAPEIAAAAGAMQAFDPNGTKWVQGALNTYLGNALLTATFVDASGKTQPIGMLVVDGDYGRRTKAAVAIAQAKLGIKVDSFAGKVTQGLLDAAIGALSKAQAPAAIPAAASAAV